VSSEERAEQRRLEVSRIRHTCIMIDPPWPERGGGKITRGAQRHYPLLKTKEIAPLIKSSGAFSPAEDAHLWIWTTDTFLRHGIHLHEELGFRYVRTFAWVKIRVDDDGHVITTEDAARKRRPSARCGIGQYARGAHELLLFGVRGDGMHESVWTHDHAVPSVIFAPHPTDENGKRIHSRKPPESYALIERVSKGPRMEMFARVERPGWSCWGNELPQKDDSIFEATQAALARQRLEAGIE